MEEEITKQAEDDMWKVINKAWDDKATVALNHISRILLDKSMPHIKMNEIEAVVNFYKKHHV